MKKIILHGHLKSLYSLPIEVEADTVAEAMKALAHIPELQPANGEPWPVTIRGVNTEIALFSDYPHEEIHVYPRLDGGGGRGGLLQIILGVTLIALAFTGVFASGALLGGLGLSKGTVAIAGALMALGGITQMLMPVPGSDKQTEGSLYLGSSVNTVRIGTTIPKLYGTRLIGGHYLSFDVDAKDIALTGDPNEAAEGLDNYVPYDRTPLADSETYVDDNGNTVKVKLVPYRAVYLSDTPSSTNIPRNA